MCFFKVHFNIVSYASKYVDIFSIPLIMPGLEDKKCMHNFDEKVSWKTAIWKTEETKMNWNEILFLSGCEVDRTSSGLCQ